MHVDERHSAGELSANQRGNDLTSHEPPRAVADGQPGTDSFCVPRGDTFHASILSRRAAIARHLSSEYVPAVWPGVAAAGCEEAWYTQRPRVASRVCVARQVHLDVTPCAACAVRRSA